MAKDTTLNSILKFINKYAFYIIITVVLLIALIILLSPPAEYVPDSTVGGPREVEGITIIAETPQSEKIKPWAGQNGELAWVVRLPDSDIKACTVHNNGITINKSANKNIASCAAACKGLNYTVAALSPMSLRTLPVCKCFSPTTTFPVSAGSFNSHFAYDSEKVSYVKDTSACTRDDCKSQSASEIEYSAKTCNTAEQNHRTTNQGYHSYHVKNTLLDSPINIWYDSTVKTLRFERENDSRDKGYLTAGTPPMNVSGLKTVFRNGDTVEVDFQLGLAYKTGHRPVSVINTTNDPSLSKINNKYYSWASILNCSIVRKLPGGNITNMNAATQVNLGFDKRATEGKLTETPDEMIVFKYNSEQYCFINRASMSEKSESNLKNVTPLYPQVAYSTRTGNNSSYFNYGNIKFDDLDDWFLITVPVGTFDRGIFQADENRTSYKLYVKNVAISNNCLSCKLREETVCGEDSILVGCGFNNKGTCSSCYMGRLHNLSDENPCGNCQIGRLMVKQPDGKIWTDANLPVLRSVYNGSNISSTFAGPFINSETAQSGQYSMKDLPALLQNRLAKTAVKTGASNGAYNFCEFMRGTIEENISTNMEHVARSQFDKFKNYFAVSTLRGNRFGPAVCQLGSNKLGLDGGYCLIAYGDLDLNDYKYSAAQQRMGYMGHALDRDRKDGCGTMWRNGNVILEQNAAFQSTGNALVGLGFNPYMRWTLSPRALWTHRDLPNYNIYQGIVWPYSDLIVTLFNNTELQGESTNNPTKFAESKNWKFTFRPNQINDADKFDKNVKAILMPPWSDIRILTSSGRREYKSNLSPDYVPLFCDRLGYSNPKVSAVTAAHEMTNYLNDLRQADENVMSPSNNLESMAAAPMSGSFGNSDTSQNDYSKPRTPDARRVYGTDYRQCYSFRNHCKTLQFDFAWLSPRVAADCRVRGLKIDGDFGNTYGSCPGGDMDKGVANCTTPNGNPDNRIWYGETDVKIPTTTWTSRKWFAGYKTYI